MLVQAPLDDGVVRMRAANKRSARFSRRRLRVAAAVVAMSCGLTAAMSLLFHGAIRLEMMLTGLVFGVIVDAVVRRLTNNHRVALRQAKRDLEERVAERTADLVEVNAELKREVRERAALQQHLVANERMAAAGAMAASISHEIRNPLMAIKCNLEIARATMSESLDEGLLECLDGGLEGAQQVKRIAIDLATLANPVDDDIESVDVAAALKVASRLAAHHMRGAELTLELDEDAVPRVMASAPRLVQVFLNLFTNAAHATDPNRHNHIAVSVHRVAGKLTIQVRDQGKGIDKGTLRRVLEPFFTTKRRTGGTGLGLSICKSIVESCGGTLSIESTVGIGTTVSITLDLASPLAQPLDSSMHMATAH